MQRLDRVCADQLGRPTESQRSLVVHPEVNQEQPSVRPLEHERGWLIA
jgi:hypothetical protein